MIFSHFWIETSRSSFPKKSLLWRVYFLSVVQKMGWGKMFLLRAWAVWAHMICWQSRVDIFLAFPQLYPNSLVPKLFRARAKAVRQIKIMIGLNKIKNKYKTVCKHFQCSNWCKIIQLIGPTIGGPTCGGKDKISLLCESMERLGKFSKRCIKIIKNLKCIKTNLKMLFFLGNVHFSRDLRKIGTYLSINIHAIIGSSNVIENFIFTCRKLEILYGF